jgi:hypothetical protein
MNLLRTALALLLLVSATASAAVDPALLDLVPQDTKVLYGVQVQQTLASPFGEFMLSRMPDNRAAMLQFSAATGFDLQRDLREILLASSTGPGNVNDGMILARGTFPIDRLMTLAGMIHATSSNHSGVSLITPAEPGARTVAILDSSTLAVGSESAVKSVIDRRASQLKYSGPLADKAWVASTKGDAWFATVTPLLEFIPATQGPFPATFLQAVIESSAGLQFHAGGVTISAEALTHSASEAEGLAGVLKFVVSMVKGPQAAALQGAHFSASGPVTSITLTIAEQDLEQAFPAPALGRAAR